MKISHKTTGFKRIVNASRYSVAGIKSAFTTEAAFRQELLLFALLLIPLILIPFDITTKMILLFSHFLVLIIELINSSIEAVVDVASPNYHKFAKIAKDTGSAAVMLSLILVTILWSVAIYKDLS